MIAIVFFSFASFAQNLLNNGDFESGGNGVGFNINGFGYTDITGSLTGSSSPGNYAVIPNPFPMNNSVFVNVGDHTTGTGRMLVVDGNTTGGQQRFWGAGSTGGGVCGLTVGQTYTFSFWIRSVSTTVTGPATQANIGIQIFNGNILTSPPSLLAPLTTSGWVKMTWTFQPTNACVNIELWNKNTNPLGNDFAVDDFEVLPPPQPLGLSYSKSDVTCFGAANGAIVAYAYNGIKPYVSYTLTGPSTITNATGIFSNLAPGTYTLSVTDSKPETVTQSSIVITQPADLVISPSTATICAGDNQTLTATGGGASYNWTSSPAGPALPTTASITVSPTVTTTYTATSTTTTTQELIFNGDFSAGNIGFGTDYQYLNPTNPSGAQRAYGIVTNASSWYPAFGACTGRGGSGNMLVADGSTFNSGNDKVWTQTIPVVPGQTYTFSYWVQSLTNTNPANLVVTVNGVILSTGLLSTTTCSWAQRTFTWNSGVATQATIVIYDRTIIPGGNDFAIDDISFTTTVNCNLTKSVTVNLNTGTTTTGFSYAPSSVCITGTNPVPTTVPGFTTGGTYSSAAGLSINPTTGVINLAASTAGTYTVTYSVAASGCSPAGSSTASITITAAVTPTTGFSYASPVCANASNPSPTTVPGFTAGGTYSSTAGLSINPTTGVINLAASTAGTYTVTYTVAASGCNPAGSSTASITITASTAPTTGFSYTSPVCSNGTNPTPTTVPGFTAGGTFSSTAGLSINSSTGVINLAVSTAGTYTVTYTVAASGCNPAGSSTASITITAAVTPTTGFSYSSPLCSNGTNPTPTTVPGFTTGGVYSSTAGLSINSSTGVINLAASTAGTYTVTYTVASSGCNPAGSSTASITIIAAVTPVTGFSYPSPVCANASNPSPTTVPGFTAGGTYSSTAGLSINPTTGVINLAASTAGTYTVTYTVAASGCNPAGSSTASISINAVGAPVTGFSYTSPVCSNGTNPVPTTVAGFTAGGTYSSTAGLSINSSTGVINLAASTAGTYTVTYAVAASGCNPAGSSTTSITITASTAPTTGFSYTSPVCSNGANPVPSTVAGFTAGGTFSSTAGLSINSSTGVINLAASTAGTYTVTYTVAASGCNPAGSSTASITITGAVTPITGFGYASPVCSNGTNPVPIPVSGFNTGGTFSSTPGLSINSATGVINLAASTPGSYMVTYFIPASGCNPASSSTTTIIISGVGTPITGFGYSSPVCITGVNPVPTPLPGFVTGGTYSSTAGLSINASTGVINLAASGAGTYTVTYTVAPSGCNAGGSSTASITITPSVPPNTNFNYSSPFCSNGTNPSPTPLPGFTAGGTFSSTTGLAISPSSGIINLAASTPGIYTVTYSVAASGCNPAGSSTATVAITPSATPVTAFAYSTLPLPSVCADEPDPVPTLNPGFTTGGIFSSVSGIVVNPSTGVVNLAASTPGTYTVTYTVAATGCNPAGSSTAVLQIKPVPATPLAASPVPFCQNAGTVPLTATGTNLLWYTNATGGTPSLIAPKPPTNTVGTVVYYVTQTVNGCESPRKKIDVIVYPLPVANAGPDKTTFIGQPVMLSGSVIGNNVSIVWTPPVAITNPTSATPLVAPSANTTYVMNVTSAEGCAARDEVNVIVLKDIIIPNVFSPNGDGINDKWIITNIEMYTGSRVEIFNRYGQKMAEIKEYNSSNAWDGTNNGKPLPVGAYYYVIRVPQGRQTIFSGSISILR
ncbi:MAG: gliding motility-associated C-terminal domain-containing protein [Chitinophagaceae bacterium]